MGDDDDEWVRSFDVSDPLKAYAGHTLYKVTSKVRSLGVFIPVARITAESFTASIAAELKQNAPVSTSARVSSILCKITGSSL